jgi:hypothetical protein
MLRRNHYYYALANDSDGRTAGWAVETPDGGWYFGDIGFLASFADNPSISVPPAGLFKPIGVFGKLWDNIPEIRTALGWATAPEQEYTTPIHEPHEFSSSISCAPLYCFSLYLPDGRRLGFRKGSWGITSES